MRTDPLDPSVTDALRGLRMQHSAGVSLEQSLETCSKCCARSETAAGFLRASEMAGRGQSFEDVLEAIGPALSGAERASLIAGWHGGRLDSVLDSLLERRELWYRTRQRIRGRMLLPLAVLVAASFIAPLPAFVMGGSALAYFVSACVPLGIAFVLWRLGAALARMHVKSSVSLKAGQPPAPPSPIDSLILSLPLAGRMEKQRNVSQFAALLGELIGAGVPITEALTICSYSMPNGVYRSEISRFADAVRSGDPVSSVLKDGPLWPPEFVAVVGTAETTGDWERALNHSARLMRERYVFVAEQLADWVPRILYAFVATFIIIQIGRLAASALGAIGYL